MKTRNRKLGRPPMLRNQTIFSLVLERWMLVELERHASAQNESKSAFIRKILDQKFAEGVSNERA